MVQWLRGWYLAVLGVGHWGRWLVHFEWWCVDGAPVGIGYWLWWGIGYWLWGVLVFHGAVW